MPSIADDHVCCEGFQHIRKWFAGDSNLSGDIAAQVRAVADISHSDRPAFGGWLEHTVEGDRLTSAPRLMTCAQPQGPRHGPSSVHQSVTARRGAALGELIVVAPYSLIGVGQKGRLGTRSIHISINAADRIPGPREREARAEKAAEQALVEAVVPKDKAVKAEVFAEEQQGLAEAAAAEAESERARTLRSGFEGLVLELNGGAAGSLCLEPVSTNCVFGRPLSDGDAAAAGDLVVLGTCPSIAVSTSHLDCPTRRTRSRPLPTTPSSRYDRTQTN